MKLLTYLTLLILSICSDSLAQEWLKPRPSQTFSPNQSIYYSGTNLFFNSFYLGGTTGFNGYFIWNGQRINGPEDFAIAVSNSVAPSNFVFKIDFENEVNELNTLIIEERNYRIGADISISNSLTFVPTNLIINYVNSSSNFLTWSSNGKTWFFNVCLTNGIGAGGFGGTNIINITNTVVAGTTYVTNFFDLSFTNTTSFILTNAFYSTVTNNIIVTNHNDFNIGSINTVVSNTFAPVNSNTVINNNIITNLFQPSNNFNPNVNVTNVFVSNVNSYPQNNITNNVTVGSTTVSNEFFITNNITVGSVIVTNNNTVTNSFSPINNVSNIISFTNTFQITNNLSVFTTNLINNSNSFTSVNNISNMFTFGDTIVTNLFDITNNITIEGVVVTNNIITTNNFSPGIDITFSPTTTNIVNNTLNNTITNEFTANISNTNVLQTTITNYITLTNLITVYATNIVEAINITNLNTFAPTNMIDISNNVVVGNTTLILSNTFVTTVSNTVEGVVNNITNVINNIIQSYTNTIGGMTNVFTAINSSSNYIAWVSNSIDGFISYNEFCVTNGSANWSTGNFANVFSDYVYNFAQNNQYSISGIVVSVMDSGVQTQGTRYITYNEPTSFDFENHSGYGWQIQTTSGLFVRVNALATNIPIGATVALTSGVYKIWNATHSSTDTIWRLNSQLPNTNDLFDITYINVSEITQNKLQLTQQTVTTNWPKFGLIKPITGFDYYGNQGSRGHIDDEYILLGHYGSNQDFAPPLYTTNYGLSYQQLPGAATIQFYGQGYFRPRNKSYIIVYNGVNAVIPVFTTNSFTNVANTTLPNIRYHGFAANEDGKILYAARGPADAGSIYRYTNFPIDSPITITNAGSRIWAGVATYDGTNVMAYGQDSSLWRSTNGGTTWVSNNLGSTGRDIVTTDGQRWWAARSSSILYSDDFGTNWFIHPFLTGNDIGFLNGTSNFLYGSINNGANFYSTNSGQSFSFLPTTLDSGGAFFNFRIQSIDASKKDQYAAFVDSFGSVYKRNDLNSVWTYWFNIGGFNFTSLGVIDVTFDPYSDTVAVYGGGANPAYGFTTYTGSQFPVPLLSTNRSFFTPMQTLVENIGGLTFTTNRIAFTHALSFAGQNQGALGSGLVQTYLFWADKTNVNYTYIEGLPRLQSVYVDGTNIFTSSGIMWFQGTTNSYDKWEPVSHNQQTGRYTGFEVYSNRLYAAQCTSGNSIATILSIPLDTNDGQIKWANSRTASGWASINPAGRLAYTGISIDDIQQSNWWVTAYGTGGCLLQSTNFGFSWFTNTTVPAASNWVSVDAFDGVVLAAYESQNGGLRRSTNNGTTFDIIRTNATTYSSVDVFTKDVAYYTDLNGIYATTNLSSTNPVWNLLYNIGNPSSVHRPRNGPTNTIFWSDSSTGFGGLWKTTNNFATAERQAPFANAGLNSGNTYGGLGLLANPANNNEILMVQGNASYPVLLSTNQGKSWVSTGLTYVYSIDTLDGNIVWAAAAIDNNNNKVNYTSQRQYFQYSTDFGRSWSSFNTTNANLVYPIRDFAVGYGNRFYVNQYGNILDSLTDPPEMLTNNTTTVTTKSASRLDSSTWKNIYDSVATYNNEFNYIQFSFNNEASYVVYNNGQWNTTVTNNAGTWQYWNGSSWVGAANTNTPKNNVLSQAVLNGPWKMTVADLGNIGDAAWEYTNGFNTNTTTNINVAISLYTTDGINPPNISSIAFSVYDGFPSYRKSDSNYLIEQSTNNFQRLTRQVTGTTDAIIHYMRNP